MKHRICGVVLALLAVAAVFLVEQFLQPSYWIKTALKAAAFLGAIALYAMISKQSLRETICLHGLKKPKPLLLGMLFFFAGVVLLFVFFRRQLDLARIKQSLIQKEQLTRENCLFIFAYIIVCNAFLEEAFFRGFVFRLSRTDPRHDGRGGRSYLRSLRAADVRILCGFPAREGRMGQFRRRLP